VRSTKPQGKDRPPPRLRRAYYDCRYGQLHVHNAIPSGGGFDELTPVICIHGTGQAGRVFLPLLATLGDARSVYALDMPGAGETDPAPGVDANEAAVHAVTDFVDSMRIRRFDLLARAEGCTTALAVHAARAAAVRRVVLLGPPPALRTGGDTTLVPLAEADTAGFAARLVALLAGPT
jgi:pimeloyl-ACP methyl ester carboxylesterase